MDPCQETLAGIRTFYTLPDLQEPSPITIKGVTRASLPVLCATLGMNRGAEIGTWEGEYAEAFCAANPALKLTCVDAWTPHRGYSSYRRPDRFLNAETLTRQRLAPYPVTILRGFSLDVVRDVPERSLDFVYIDANHTFDACIQDIIQWSARVRRGGIIAGHDYAATAKKWGFGVVEAVHAYTHAHDITPWFILGRWKRRAGEIGEHYRTWFWINP